MKLSYGSNADVVESATFLVYFRADGFPSILYFSNKLRSMFSMVEPTISNCKPLMMRSIHSNEFKMSTYSDLRFSSFSISLSIDSTSSLMLFL